MADPGGSEGAMPPPPGPVKISHKKDGHQRWLHRFHVSHPLPLTQPLDLLLKKKHILAIPYKGRLFQPSEQAEAFEAIVIILPENAQFLHLGFVGKLVLEGIKFPKYYEVIVKIEKKFDFKNHGNKFAVAFECCP